MGDQSVYSHNRANRCHRYAYLWTVERVDGITYYMTDHSHKLTDEDDNEFRPITGVTASALDKQSAFKESNAELIGFVNSPQITDDDLFAGFFLDAKITVRLVDWMWPWAGAIVRNVMWIDFVEFDNEVWTIQVSGPTRWLRTEVGEVYSINCRYTLGDGRCKFLLASDNLYPGASPPQRRTSGESMTVNTVDATDPRLKFTVTLTNDQESAILEDDYTWGYLEWTDTGLGDQLNDGLFSEIKKSDAVVSGSPGTMEITLQVPTKYDIDALDSFTIYAGCNGKLSVCDTKFGQKTNFGGQHLLPGTDELLQQGGAFQ